MKNLSARKIISIFTVILFAFLQSVPASFAGGPTDVNQPVTNDLNPGVSATGTPLSPSTPVVNQNPTTIDSLMGNAPISSTTSDIQPHGGFPAPQLPVLVPGLPVYIPPMVDAPQEFELAKTSVAGLSFGTSALVIEKTKPSSHGAPYTFEAIVMEGITANGNTVVSRTPLTPGSFAMPNVRVGGQTLAVGVSAEGEGLICVPVAAGQVTGADGRQHGKLTFASIPKATYAIQTSTDMRTWTTVTTLATTTSWIDPVPASGFKFYRVVVTGVDITPPSIAVFETFPHVTNNPDLTVSYTVDGGAVQTKSFTLSATNGGVNNLSITEVDAAGNESTVHFTVILDTKAPVVVSTSPIPSLTNNGLLTVNYTVDGMAQVPIEVTLKEGDNAVVIPAQQDEAGNVTPAQTFHVTLDSHPPAGTIAINNGNVTTLSPYVTLTLEASDATSGVDQMRFSVNGGQTWSDWENFASSKALSLPAGDGTKGVLCQVKDLAGNSAVFSNSIILDSTPQTSQDVRKTLILGSLTDPAGHSLTYSFTSAPVLSQNGQFVLLGNQLTYIPNKNFIGSGVVTVSVSGGFSPVQYPVTLSVVAPVIHTPNDPSLSAQWGLYTIDALRAWSLSRGVGVSVGVLDTGIAVFDTGIIKLHEDLSGSIFTNPGEIGLDANGKDKATNGIDDDGNGYVDDIHGWNFDILPYKMSPSNDPMDNYNYGGHGTSVGGVIAAQSDNGKGGVGIAPDAKLIPVKVLNRFGYPVTALADFVPMMQQAIHYVIALGAKVINMSWGFLSSYFSAAQTQLLQALFDAAHAAGVMIVVSAGNDYGNVDSYFPAAFNNIVAVSATDSVDQRAADEKGYWSNSGNAIDFSAPGVGIFQPSFGGDYTTRGGTSFSAPLVSGLAAMIFSQDPTATPDDVYRRLKYSSVDLGTSGWDPYFGWGRINAFQALSYDYYDTGAIKTQWLESPDENGWNKLSFDIQGYLTGGTHVNVPSFSGSGTKSLNAVAPASKPVVTSAASSSPEVFETQFSKNKGIGPWRGWAGSLSGKAKKKEEDGMSKAGVVLSADKKKASEAPKTKVKESKKNLSQTPQPLRVSPAAQKTLPESLQNGTILRSVLGSPLPGSVVSLLGAETNIRQIPPRR